MNQNEFDIKSYLLQFADLKQYWILRAEHVQPGLIHYLGSDATA